MYLLEIDEYLFGVVDDFPHTAEKNPIPMLSGVYTGDSLDGYNPWRGRENRSGAFVLFVHDQQLRGLEPYLPGIEFLGSFDKWWVLRDRKKGKPFTLTVYKVEKGDYQKWQETKVVLWKFYKCLVDRENPSWAAFGNNAPHPSGEPQQYRIPFIFEDCEIFTEANACETIEL